MIKVDRGNIHISGNPAEIVNDLADAIKGVKNALANGGGCPSQWQRAWWLMLFALPT